MKIAELFVSLGIAGAEETKKKLQGVSSGLGEVKSNGLAAKAMLLGVMYGMQQLMSRSMAAGMSLKQFSDYTGMSTQMLEKYQYAGRKVGIANDTMASTFMNLQAKMAELKMSGALPQWLSTVSKYTGGMDLGRATRDTQYLFDKLSQFAKADGISRDVKNNILGTFGLSGDVVGGMNAGVFDSKNLSRAPTRSDGMVKSLAAASAAWAELENKMSRGFDNLTSRHGKGFIENISQLVGQIIKLGDSLLILAEKVKIFEHVGTVMNGWLELTGLINKAVGNKEEDADLSKNPYAQGSKMREFYQKALDEEKSSWMRGGAYSKKAISPNVGMGWSKAPATVNQTATVNFTISERDLQDAQKISGSVSKAIKDALSQSPINGVVK